jgi:hypothetical protein
MPWDEYWRAQLEVGVLEQAFDDMMASDPELPPLLAHRHAPWIQPGNPTSPEQDAREWARENGFVECSGRDRQSWDLPGRMSRLTSTTG